MTENKDFLLDINDIELTHNGVCEFYWPILPHEINKFFKRLIRTIVEVILRARGEKIYGVDEAIILSLYFAQETAMVYQAYLLLKRASRDNYEIKASKRSRLINAFLKNESPAASIIMCQLRRGPPPLKKWRAPLRLVQDIVVGFQQGMARRILWPINYKKRIISMTIDPVSLVMVKRSKQKVIYKRPNHWFSAPPNEIDYNHSYDEVINRIVQSTMTLFSSVNVQLPDFIKTYLMEWLKEAMILVGWYLSELEKKSHKIPDKLWTNTAGYVWTRILSRYVREKGGKITRHTHAGGGGYFDDSWSQSVFEFEDCDTFVAFSDKHIESYCHAFTGEDIVQENLPEFVALNSNVTTVPINTAIKPIKKSSPKTIMYASTVYPGEFIYPATNGLMSDIVLLDWEVRLTARLQKWGYRVLLKPHPVDSLCVAPPASISKIFGPVVIEDLFENVIYQADVIIMDAPISSVFFTSIKSNQPFVYMDFKITSFTPKAYDLLGQRCPIVKGWYDSNNRACIDWDALQHAIDTCNQYNDQSFTQQYLIH